MRAPCREGALAYTTGRLVEGRLLTRLRGQLAAVYGVSPRTVIFIVATAVPPPHLMRMGGDSFIYAMAIFFDTQYFLHKKISQSPYPPCEKLASQSNRPSLRYTPSWSLGIFLHFHLPHHIHVWSSIIDLRFFPFAKLPSPFVLTE